MLIGWNGETIPALPLEQELEVISKVGYGGLEIFVPKLAPYLEKHTVKVLAHELSNRELLPLAMNGIENISFRSENEFTKVKEECQWLSEISKKIGCPTIVVVPSPRPRDLSWWQIKEETASALRDLADIAAHYGVKLAFEFLAAQDCSVRTIAQGWEIIQATGRENVGLVIDTYHFYVGGSSWESLEEFDIGNLLIVHINDVEDLPLTQLTDGHRLLCGEGILPLKRLLLKIHERGYGGAYSLEVMRPAYRERDPLEYVRAALETSSKILQETGII